MPASGAGTAAGVLNTSRQVGGAVAIAVFGALVASRSHFVQGFQLSLMIAVAVLALSALASLRLPRSRPAGRLAGVNQPAREGARTEFMEAA